MLRLFAPICPRVIHYAYPKPWIPALFVFDRTPLGGLYFFPATCNWRSAGGEPAIRGSELWHLSVRPHFTCRKQISAAIHTETPAGRAGPRGRAYALIASELYSLGEVRMRTIIIFQE